MQIIKLKILKSHQMLKLLSKLIFIILISTNSFLSQKELKIDWSYITEKTNQTTYKSAHFEGRKVSYIFGKSKNKLVKYNPVSLLFGGLLITYQKVISDQFFTMCSYRVSCSDFAKNAIFRYGLFKGVPLAADRLMRCNKLSFEELSNEDIDFKNEKILDNLDKYHL